MGRYGPTLYIFTSLSCMFSKIIFYIYTPVCAWIICDYDKQALIIMCHDMQLLLLFWYLINTGAISGPSGQYAPVQLQSLFSNFKFPVSSSIWTLWDNINSVKDWLRLEGQPGGQSPIMAAMSYSLAVSATSLRRSHSLTRSWGLKLLVPNFDTVGAKHSKSLQSDCSRTAVVSHRRQYAPQAGPNNAIGTVWQIRLRGPLPLVIDFQLLVSISSFQLKWKDFLRLQWRLDITSLMLSLRLVELETKGSFIHTCQKRRPNPHGSPRI